MTLLSIMELIVDELREEEEFLEESSLSDSESEGRLDEADDEELLEESFDAEPVDVDVVVARIREQYLKDK
jgi:hypothetical protein